MGFFVWKCVPVGNACVLDSIENVERSQDLYGGVPMRDFPADALFRMSKQHKKDTGLTDDLGNLNMVKVCSPRLVEFLKARKLKNVEYLPVTILDHKGKVASKAYSIVHPVHLQAALDLKASQPTYNAVKKDQIDSVEQLVIDARRLDPEVELFRLQGLDGPVIVTGGLAEAIKAGGFVGPAFRDIARFRS